MEDLFITDHEIYQGRQFILLVSHAKIFKKYMYKVYKSWMTALADTL